MSLTDVHFNTDLHNEIIGKLFNKSFMQNHKSITQAVLANSLLMRSQSLCIDIDGERINISEETPSWAEPAPLDPEYEKEIRTLLINKQLSKERHQIISAYVCKTLNLANKYADLYALFPDEIMTLLPNNPHHSEKITLHQYVIDQHFKETAEDRKVIKEQLMFNLLF